MPEDDALPSLVDAGGRVLGYGDDVDVEIGPLGYGCWRFEPGNVAKVQELIETALELDMNLFDTADIYGRDASGGGFGMAEELVGQVLAAQPDLRDRMIIATKGGIRPGVPYDSSPAYLTQACEDSLARLGVDVIDVYQVHRPDLFTHPLDVAETLDALVDEGKVRSVGISNYTPAQANALMTYLEAPIVSTQPEFSAACTDPMRDGTFDLAMEHGHAVLAYSPLAAGRIGTGDVPAKLVKVLDELAAREGVDRTTISIAFVLAAPSSPVALLGTQQPDRLRAAQQALTVHLDRVDCYRIIEASEGVPLP